MAINLKGRSFLSIMDFSTQEVRYLLDMAHDLKARKRSGLHSEVLKMCIRDRPFIVIMPRWQQECALLILRNAFCS